MRLQSCARLRLLVICKLLAVEAENVRIEKGTASGVAKN